MGFDLIIFIIIIILNIVAGYIYYTSNKNLTECETNESPLCPIYVCPQIDSLCQNKPFRFNNGTKVCMADSLHDISPMVS